MQSFTIDGIVVMPPLQAEYRLDPTIETVHTTITFEQGHSFEYYEFMGNLRSNSINRSSAFFLTNSSNVTDFFDIKRLPFEYPINITSYIAFNSLKTDPFSGLSAITGTCLTSTTATTAVSALSSISDTTTEYLTIKDDVSLQSDGTETRLPGVDTFIFKRTQSSLPQSYYFNIMIIDAVNCYIYHLEGDDRWYLTHKPEAEEEFKFTKISHVQGLENVLDEIEKDGGDKIKFQYTYDEKNNLFRVFKQHNGSTHVLKLKEDIQRDALTESGVPIVLYDLVDPDNDLDASTGAPNILENTEKTTLRIRAKFPRLIKTGLTPHVVNYNKSTHNNDISVNGRSKKPQKVNSIVHTEYYYLTGESLPVNFFNLKNQQTPDGHVRGSLMDPREQSPYYHRDYNKIYTGTNQAEGATNISLEYSTKSHRLDLSPGMNYFNMPQSLHPYNKININDTTLIEAGALAGSHPALSDKIFKKRAGDRNYSKHTRWGVSNEEQLGTWLCTWLSGGDDPKVKPIWVDRYYNPTSTGYVQALTQITQFVHNEYKSDSLDIFTDTNEIVFDVPSKLTLEPGLQYAYHRISPIDIENNISLFNQHHVQQGFSSFSNVSNKPGEPKDGTYNFNGSMVARTGELIDKNITDELSIYFDINLTNYKTVKNHQILGNYTLDGLGLFDTPNVSPFVFLLGADGQAVGSQKQDSSIRIYDNNYKLYNYITNDSFITSGETPALFLDIIIRELPENLFAVMSDGRIIEMTYDGVIVSDYTAWKGVVEIDSGTNYPKLKSVCYDNRYIYLLSHTGTGKRDYNIHVFDMLNKSIEEFADKKCIFHVPVPRYVKNNTNLNVAGPPNILSIHKDRGSKNHRALYLAYGDKHQTGNRYLYYYVKGTTNELTQVPSGHDMIYSFDTKTLRLLNGALTDNNLADTTQMLSIVDFKIDGEENLWVAHGQNLVSKFTPTRKLLLTQELAEQTIVTMICTKDFSTNGKIVEKLVILGNTSGEQQLQLQIGPENHPTNNPNHPDYRKASPWYQDYNGELELYTRERFTDTNSLIYDDLSTFDDSTQILYPFSDGASRFGEQLVEIADVPSDDIAGKVIDGDYELITESFDYFVTEQTAPLKGTVIDLGSGLIDSQFDINNLVIEDLYNLPVLYSHYNYSMCNFENYYKNGLNMKIMLQPLFKQTDPDLVNFLINLDDFTDLPYTDFINLCLNINNKKGVVELWMNGRLRPDHIYKFDPHKHTFSNILNREIVAGVTPYLNNTTIYEKLNTRERYLVRDVIIRDFNIYNKCLEYHDILNMQRKRNPIESIQWEIPTSSRNYIETIDRLFNHSIPPRMSNVFDVVVRNSSISSLALQTYISNKVTAYLTKLIPAGTRVRNISWSNELLDFFAPEGDDIDYNPVADEIIVDPSGITLPAYLPYILQ